MVDLFKGVEELRRLRAAPDRIDALEKRVRELELGRALKPSELPMACKKCRGPMAFQRESLAPPPFNAFGDKQEFWRCEACNWEGDRIVSAMA